MRVSQMENFNTSIGQLGVSQNVLALAGGITGVVAFLLNMFVGGLAMLVGGYLFFKFVALPFAEWVIEKIPKNYIFHWLEWVVTMNNLYITNDSDPVPVLLPEQRRTNPMTEQRGLQRADPNAF